MHAIGPASQVGFGYWRDHLLQYHGSRNLPVSDAGWRNKVGPDGVAWTKDANPVLSPTAGSWDANEVYAPSVVMNGSVFEMFYSGNAGGKWQKIETTPSHDDGAITKSARSATIGSRAIGRCITWITMRLRLSRAYHPSIIAF